MRNRALRGLMVALTPALGLLVACGSDGSGGGSGGSGGAAQGGSAGAAAGAGGAGGSSAAANGGSSGSANGGSGGIPTECNLPISGEMREIHAQVDFASFEYFSESSCRITGQTSAVGPFSVLRSTSTNGGFHVYAAEAFSYAWVSTSEGERVGDHEIRPLPEDTDISATLRSLADQSEVDVVFRLSGTQLTVLSVTERK